MTEQHGTHPEPFVAAPEDAPAFWQNDALWVVLASGEGTRGAFTMIEQLMPQGNGPPPHVHERMSEAFYVIEGEMEFQVGTDLVRAAEGFAVWIPPGTPHGFRVRSETARALNMYAPGGFDDNVSMLGTPAAARTLPPEGAVEEATPEQEEAFLRRIRDLHTQTWADVPNLLAVGDGG